MSGVCKKYCVMLSRTRQIVCATNFATHARRCASKWPKDRIVIWVYEIHNGYEWDFLGELGNGGGKDESDHGI